MAPNNALSKSQLGDEVKELDACGMLVKCKRSYSRCRFPGPHVMASLLFYSLISIVPMFSGN